jgi:hypothetical protein
MTTIIRAADWAAEIAPPAVMQIVGNAATLQEAQQELAENWRRWLAWAALTPDGMAVSASTPGDRAEGRTGTAQV